MRRPQHHPLSRRAAAAVVLAVALVGCTSDDGDGGDPDPTTATDTASPTTAATTETGFDGSVATGVGVTEAACPDAVNPDNGCIHLGTLSDLTEGPFAALAVPITAAQAAFWNRVNEAGGIGGAYDVDVTEFTRDNRYDPEAHATAYREIEPEVLALAQSLGSATTAAVVEDMVADDMVVAPASWTSLWDMPGGGGTNVLESGNNHCVESMNAVDHHAEGGGDVGSVLAVHVPGPYGEDGAAGARLAADAADADFRAVEIPVDGAGPDLADAIEAMVDDEPDVVVVTASPVQVAELIGGAAAQGFEGAVYGNGPTWTPALLDTPSAPAIEAMYTLSGPWASFDADTPGHAAMREALGAVDGNEGYTAGWALSYPLLAALEQAHAAGDLTRAGLVAAAEDLEAVDYEGMLPEEAGTFTGDANDQVFRGTMFGTPDSQASSGITTEASFFFGPTARDHDFSQGSCVETVDLG